MAMTNKNPVITLTEEEYMQYCDDNYGVCIACGELAEGGCEPDAENYECETCGEHRVMGLENALMCGYVSLDEPSEESEREDE